MEGWVFVMGWLLGVIVGLIAGKIWGMLDTLGAVEAHLRK